MLGNRYHASPELALLFLAVLILLVMWFHGRVTTALSVAATSSRMDSLIVTRTEAESLRAELAEEDAQIVVRMEELERRIRRLEKR